MHNTDIDSNLTTAVPKFHELFSNPGTTQRIDEDDFGPELSPRNALALWSIATEMYDYAIDDIDDIAEGISRFTDSLVYGGLPPTCRNVDKVWLERFAQCFMDIATKLEHGEVPYPTCTGEEVALHLVLKVVEDDIECTADGETMLGTINMVDVLLAEDSRCQRREDDFDTDYLREALYEDSDYETLYDMQLDGIEKSDVGAMLGIGNLATGKWFLPFRP